MDQDGAATGLDVREDEGRGAGEVAAMRCQDDCPAEFRAEGQDPLRTPLGDCEQRPWLPARQPRGQGLCSPGPRPHGPAEQLLLTAQARAHSSDLHPGLRT